MKKISTAFYLLLVLMFCGCTGNTVYDDNVFIPAEGWHYKNRAQFNIELSDTASFHNIYINLRITPDYEYSNLYVLFHAKSPAGDSTTRRIDLTLAESNGHWLGKGTASIISYRIPIIQKFVPKKAGTYHFEIEQNMRTNTLKEVINIGIGVEKGDVVF